MASLKSRRWPHESSTKWVRAHLKKPLGIECQLRWLNLRTPQDACGGSASQPEGSEGLHSLTSTSFTPKKVASDANAPPRTGWREMRGLPKAEEEEDGGRERVTGMGRPTHQGGVGGSLGIGHREWQTLIWWIIRPTKTRWRGRGGWDLRV
ncbi:uncharacterized protein A4U43_C03F17100 [Asparagus officinalis]|uniref:Uncharacterized protein n=1 Tax=Asparagus officinalis TaxID=4686 RepID=A0A5P1FCH8_ASPOF|nr:uncharacterized protein A4U43_C03F17100 [Asparagus officinalis]